MVRIIDDLSSVLGGRRRSGRAAGPGTPESGGVCRVQPSPLTSQAPPTPCCPPGLRRLRGDPSCSCPEASWELQDKSCCPSNSHTAVNQSCLIHSSSHTLLRSTLRSGEVGQHQEHSLHVATWRLTLASPRCLCPRAASPEAAGQTGGR